MFFIGFLGGLIVGVIIMVAVMTELNKLSK